MVRLDRTIGSGTAIGREALSVVYRGHSRDGVPLPMARSGACHDAERTARWVKRSAGWYQSRGHRDRFSHALQKLERAKPAGIVEIEISPSGLGLHFRRNDMDLYLPALPEGVFGSRKWMAARTAAAAETPRPEAKEAIR